LLARNPELSEEEQLRRYRSGNLLGNPEEVMAQIREYEAAGVDSSSQTCSSSPSV
jgi:alkanesulfonate monooxygenase SsuD/methylene tetrahydromethanopterin reductase-like flavin-dependent oxidoreductase (luciferase family)